MNEIKKLHRRDDMDTSVDAAYLLESKLSGLQAKVLAAMARYPGGLTDEELENLPEFGDQYSQTTISKRRTDLRDRGLVIDTGNRRRNRRGHKMAVWILEKYYDDYIKNQLPLF